MTVKYTNFLDSCIMARSSTSTFNSGYRQYLEPVRCNYVARHHTPLSLEISYHHHFLNAPKNNLYAEGVYICYLSKLQ